LEFNPAEAERSRCIAPITTGTLFAVKSSISALNVIGAKTIEDQRCDLCFGNGMIIRAASDDQQG
jgi:hypothetical protein